MTVISTDLPTQAESLSAAALVQQDVGAGALVQQDLVRAPSLWRDYLTLTKPRVMSLLVFSAMCAMVAGADGAPGAGALLALTLGGCLACGGAGAFNHVIDRDIDRLMGERTAGRPVAAGRISPLRATIFASALSVLSFLVIWSVDNLLAAELALAGGAFYVVIYTLGLKRRTTSNIVIGGAAGAFPVLCGWAAAHGTLAPGAWWLFAVVLVWTPPHFWSLAVLLRSHYANAEVPMLPVVKGDRHTAAQVMAYSVLLVAVSVVPGLTGVFGPVYLLSAIVLGIALCVLAWRLWRVVSHARAAYMFHFSLLYLALLFLAVAVDAVVVG